MSRATTFNDTVADTIVERMVDGESLRQICRDPDMPALRTVFNWLSSNPEFKHAYGMAADLRLDTWAEDVVDIADAGEVSSDAVQRDRLKIDSRKWLMARLMPRKYGDKQQVETTAEVSIRSENKPDYGRLTREERDAMRQLLLKAAPKPDATR